VYALTPVQNRLVLLPVPPLVVVVASGRSWSGEHADGQQLLQSRADLLSTRKAREICLGEGILALGPEPGVGRVAVFQPAIRVGDGLTMKDLYHWIGRSFRV
jgi:hypothetical protein